MRERDLQHLICPSCKRDLVIDEIIKEDRGVIEEGKLKCSRCVEKYDIIRCIPRFVPSQRYTSGFGLEWTRHARTQYDSYSGMPISETRFFEETKWPRHLAKQLILEVGSGSGRFTEVAASTGAMVISIDLSNAVEANYASNGGKANVLIVQGDLYQMPFKDDYFDKVFCIGVLQHAPDTREAFMSLPRYLKSGGNVVIDVYGKSGRLLNLRRLVRLFTKRIPPEKLYKRCAQYVEWMWPLVRFLDRHGGTRVIGLSLIPYYKQYGLSDRMLKEWALLDLFDIVSATYEFPQSVEIVHEWFSDANMRNIEVQWGYNGIEGRGNKV
jgi:SAM-dependent methyltransferase